ncbi:Alpha/Beta hydrolase protein [Schizophyllum fasciatum]
MEIFRLQELPYAGEDDTQRSYDLYFPLDERQFLPEKPSADPPVIIFVHGGAWRSEDKGDHRPLAEELVRRTRACVAVPNYRLSPRTPPLHHPTHAADLLTFLAYLYNVGYQTARGTLRRTRWYLVGHSCSAHMIASIVLDSSAATPSLAPPAGMLAAVRGVVFSEGIYDLDALLKKWPEYGKWFIHDAFGEKTDYSAFSVAKYPARKSDIRWLLLHSSGDELVDLGQTEIMGTHLRAIHEGELDAVTTDTNVLTDKHDDVLKNEYYLSKVSQFVLDLDNRVQV